MLLVSVIIFGSRDYNHKKYICKCYIYNMVNVYKNRSRISSSKFRKILRLFLLDIEAVKVSKIIHISRQGINRIYKYIRLKNARKCYIRIRINRVR